MVLEIDEALVLPIIKRKVISHQGKIKELRHFCKTQKSRMELQNFIGLKDEKF